MKKLALLVVCCFLFAAGCQDQPSSTSGSGTSTGSQPAATETPAPVSTPAPDANRPVGNENQAVNPDGSLPVGEAPAAGSTETMEHPLKDKLAHHNYVLKTVDGQEFAIKLPEGAESSPWTKPNLSFGQWPHASGKICNNYRGNVEIESDKLYLKNAASTMMLCGDTGLSEFEGLFYQMMSNGVQVGFGENDKTLTLTGDGHVLVFDLADYVN